LIPFFQHRDGAEKIPISYNEKFFLFTSLQKSKMINVKRGGDGYHPLISFILDGNGETCPGSKRITYQNEGGRMIL
jgi:hypothetical protein